jgi:DNA mismatch repair protein MutS
MHVPGCRARISPVDNIFTHFQLEENIANATGRFADEVKRFADCVGRATSESLLLLNESFASTSYVESLFIARDALRALRLLGLRVVFSTHFHDLALEVEAINAEPDGTSRLVSLVSLVDAPVTAESEVVRTFRIVPHPPIGRSYAAEIAYKYGISFEQLREQLKARGAI